MPLAQFSAPGRLTDFNTAEQASRWSDDLQDLFSQVIAQATPCVAAPKLQFASPMDIDTSAFELAEISWPGFPNSLLAEGGPGGSPLTTEEAYQAADQPGEAGRDLMDEYLEWFVHRENGEIVAIDFTTETEHYWESLFKLDKALAAEAYSSVTGLTVTEADITGPGNRYNPRNPFNTTRGIVHLIQGSNTLGAELDIACQSTRLRTEGSGEETNDIVGCLRCRSRNPIGGATRNSDPKISNTVSIKADEGRMITIPDPVGLYIARLDTRGWHTPDGSDPQACWTILRGEPGVRARFEVPNRKFKISDMKIGADSIKYAGQIAEHVFVKLTAALGPPGQFIDRPTSPCAAGGQGQGFHHSRMATTRV